MSANRRSSPSPEEIRRQNLAALLRHVHRNGATTRAQLTTDLGLNRSTIGALTTDLAAAGLVTEEVPRESGRSRAGRPSLVVKPESHRFYTYALSIEVDRIRAARVGLGGEILDRREAPRSRDREAPDTAEPAAALVHDMHATAPSDAIYIGCGVVVCGMVRRADGMVRLSPNTGWVDEPFAEALRPALALDTPPTGGSADASRDRETSTADDGSASPGDRADTADAARRATRSGSGSSRAASAAADGSRATSGADSSHSGAAVDDSNGSRGASPADRSRAAAPLDRPITVGNVADASALAEHTRGAARGLSNVIYLYGDVGIGAGIITGGHRLAGHAGYGGEVGHMVVHPGGRECGCGSRGCWETEIGERALLDTAGRTERVGRDAVLSVIDAARRGDSAADRAVRQVGDWLGFGVANLVNIFNPEVVLFGGTLRDVYLAAAATVRSRLNKTALPACREQLRLRTPELGDDAALIGAAEMAFEALLTDPLAEAPLPGPPRRHHVRAGMRPAGLEHDLLDDPHPPRPLHRLREQPLVLGQQHRPPLRRQHPRDLPQHRRVQPLVPDVRPDPLAERQVRHHPLHRPVRHRQPPRVPPPQPRRRRVLARRQHPPPIVVRADDPRPWRHLTRRHQQRPRPAHRIQHPLPRLDLRQPHHHRSHDGVRRGRGPHQLPEPLRPVQPADLRHRPGDVLEVHIPVPGLVAPPHGRQLIPHPPPLADLPHPEPHRPRDRRHHPPARRLPQPRRHLVRQHDGRRREIPHPRQRPQAPRHRDHDPVPPPLHQLHPGEAPQLLHQVVHRPGHGTQQQTIGHLAVKIKHPPTLRPHPANPVYAPGKPHVH
ncbi:ROK family protein [Stackebrandtia nassauensis DSM 44728]|uniref:ROK family protein n=1 Tax=Stackebrandtia nassauensis (strain DSM 44728 / CIP 108903 / NRRL B-16338 / NBRC 102104 / LLR-40K-21) TaxID=446470 RepID=D3QB16_STANL|nr:ROK family transcriptional regulator [Stackebrandtia nassauensis]ADD40833.1 ROK family protein [Stackebrandtia nassauensis DSM 44728]